MINNLYIEQLEHEITHYFPFRHVTETYNNALMFNTYETDPLVHNEQDEYIRRLYDSYVLEVKK